MASSTRNINYPGSEMVRWVNDTLSKGMEETVKRIEDLGKGIAYCQMVHLLYPIHIKLSKVKYMCLREEDRYSNFKLLEAALQEIGTKVDIPIAKLIKCKFEENYKFVLWFRKFFDPKAKNTFYYLSKTAYLSHYYAKIEREAASQIDTSTCEPLCLASTSSAINVIASPKVPPLKPIAKSSLQSIKSIRSEKVLEAIYETNSPIVYTSDGEDSSCTSIFQITLREHRIAEAQQSAEEMPSMMLELSSTNVEDGSSAAKESKPHISQNSSTELTMCDDAETNDEQIHLQRLEALVNYWHSLNSQGDIDYEFLVSLEKIVKSWPGIRCDSFEDHFQRELFDD